MKPKEHGPYDEPGQKAAEAKQAEALRLARNREVDDFKWLMGNRQGRRIMWRLLSITGIFRNAHVPGTDDDLFRLGEQNVGQQLIAEIHTICPERYFEMTKEHLEWQAKAPQ